MNIRSHVHTMLRISPRLFLACALGGVVIAPSRTTWVFLAAVLLTEVVVAVVKHLARATLGKQHPWGQRPRVGPTGCSTIFDGTIRANYAMPSGHTTTAFMVATFWTMVLTQHLHWPYPTETLVQVAALAAVALAVATSRVIVGCHSVLQVLVGAALGIALGWVGASVQEGVLS